MPLVAVYVMSTCFRPIFLLVSYTPTGPNLASVGVIVLMCPLSIYHFPLYKEVHNDMEMLLEI